MFKGDSDLTSGNGAAGTRGAEDGIDGIRASILAKLPLAVGKETSTASARDWYLVTALAARDRVVHRWIETNRRVRSGNSKRVYYLSLEFLIGRLLGDVLNNLGIEEPFGHALGDLGVDLDRLSQVEPDAALGNGGLGRLAACFMESMATLEIPAIGYGIRYDHGLFRQVIKNGVQQEFPETWLSFGNPWEFERPEIVYDVGFGGSVEMNGGPAAVWHPAETVVAVAFDTPIVGWRGRHVNTLRLWSARAIDPLRLDVFNMGDHVGALSEQSRAEAISKVLYPSDATPAGHELRFRQEYFFVSASLQDLVHRHMRKYGDIRSLPDRAAIQLNDTHPSIGVAELMRLLVDMHRIGWDEAWSITRRTFSYTNHTLLPEALEKWPVELFERMLPRHMQIIYLINAAHLDAARRFGDVSDEVLASLSLIEEKNGRAVKMGTLACVGSHKVNGVSALHSELMRRTVFNDIHALDPTRIVNKTNGVTFRRWFRQTNRGLTDLVSECVGVDVTDHPEALAGFADCAGDAGVRARAESIRHDHKVALARIIRESVGIRVNPRAMFDVQIKRIHEYKRQLLNVLEAIALYEEMRKDPGADWAPRVKLFAGKAAATYHVAKLIIRLANDVGAVVNADPVVRDLLKIVFLPNFNVSLAQRIVPASDLSEQISTAGMEASGTGNMKLGLNGALTIGTLDGANVEMLEAVGAENIVIFGLTAEEVAARRLLGCDPAADIAASPRLAAVLDLLASGRFSPEEPDRYAPLVWALRHEDRFLVAADFEAYWTAQRSVDARWREPEAWWRSSILNTARMGYFSSDRTIAEYASEIWNVPVPARH